MSVRPRRVPFAANGPAWFRLAAVLMAGALPAPALAQVDCANAPASWVFCTDFEEGDFHLWDDWDGNPSPTNTLVSDPGPFNIPGNHVARLFVPPGRGVADLTKVLPLANDVLYARWFVKWESGFSFTTPQHGPAGVLFDDVVVSTSPIGAGTAGAPSESQGWDTLKALFR